MKRIKDNTPLNYKDNEQIEDMIFEKVSAVSANDFDDRYGFHNVAKGTGLTIRLLDKDMNELGYTFVRQTEPMGYDLCRVYKKDNIETYVFLNEVSGVDERNKPLNGYYTLVCANSYYKNGVSDNRKIKDENTMDVLDGVLFIAFEDGTEDEMIAEVNKHKNESGKIDGVQYETYETDSSDGVAMIDLCAMTDDANGFVKALLNEWGVAENVIDLEFQASDEMKEAVNDSRKRVRDGFGIYTEPLFNFGDKVEYDDLGNKIVGEITKRMFNQGSGWIYQIDGIMKKDGVTGWHVNAAREKDIKPVSDSRRVKDSQSQYQRKYQEIVKLIESKMKGFDLTSLQAEKILHKEGLDIYNTKGNLNYWAFLDDNAFDDVLTIRLKRVGIWLEQTYITDDFYITGVGLVNENQNISKETLSDSRKVNDMTKPAHLRGYAEKVRAKRRNKNTEPTDEPENEKQDVADSRIRDGFATRYDVAYNEDPYKLAQRIAKNGTISTRSRHQRPHDVNVNKDTIFHVYNDRDYSYDDFMTKYGVSDSVSIDEPIDYNEVKSVSDELHYLDVLRSSNLIDGDYMGQGEIFEIIESIDEARLGLQYCLDDFLKEFKKYENGDSDDWRDYAYQARDYFEIFEEYCNEYVKNSGRGVEYFNAITDTKALLDKIDTWL